MKFPRSAAVVAQVIALLTEVTKLAANVAQAAVPAGESVSTTSVIALHSSIPQIKFFAVKVKTGSPTL